MVDLAKPPLSVARRFFIVTTTIVILIGIPCGGWFLYKKLEPRRLTKKARVFLQKGNSTDAVLCIRQALTINPNDVDTNRLLAEMEESSGDSTAVVWRSRLVDLQAGSLAAVTECVDTALRFGQPAAAKSALERVKDGEKANSAYHEMFGRTAAALNQANLAVEHFTEALRLDSQNESLQSEYAASLLHRGWLEDRAGARDRLEQLSATPKLRAFAFRALVKDSLANFELTTATNLAQDLAANPDADFSDRVTYLDLLRRTASPDFSATLAWLKTAARGKVQPIAEMLVWMNRSDMAHQAVEWTDDFSAEEWSDPRVCAAAAMCSLTLADWVRLESLTQGEWQNLEHIRCALLARALREQGKHEESLQQWRSAEIALARQPRAASDFAKLIADWGWDAEFEGLLRIAVNDDRQDDWALRTLLSRMVRKKDTLRLWELTARVMKMDIGNDAAANNFAMYSFLLGRDVSRACEVARALYEKHPTEAKYVSTYAYSLHVRRRSEQAIQVMNSLTPEQLEVPDVATYYGILLAATGDRERAARFLDLAHPADMLPEEQSLIQLARHQLE